MEITEKVIGSLVLIVFLIWSLAYLYTRLFGMSRGRGGGVLRVITTIPLGPKSSLTVIELAGEYLLLGVGPESVTLLTRVTDREAVERWRKEVEQRS